MKVKGYIISSVCGIACVLLGVSSVIYRIDPYFQYHVPNEEMAYNMATNSFSYYNAGIAKNFAYDTVVTGSSMSRAMLPSYIDEVFGGQTVKLSMAEARGKDLSILFSVIEENSNLKRVILGLDTFAFMVDKDYSSYEMPMYLYDNNPINDVQYLMNMDSLLECEKVMDNTENGGTTTSMDDYQNYVLTNTFSKEKVIQLYNSKLPIAEATPTDLETMKKMVVENMEQNLIPMIERNPRIEFLFYFPPYSITRWAVTQYPADEIACMKLMVEKLIDYPNVSLYFYQGEQAIITDLEHYMDTIHFDSVIANHIVDFIADESNKLTSENYESILKKFEEFICGYDYELLRE